MSRWLPIVLLVACLLLFNGEAALREEDEEYAGGQATVFDVTPDAFSRPAPGLDDDQELLFFVGNSFFEQNWVTAPASAAARDGLGPFFNSRSCAGCHFKDGRAAPHGPGLLMRLSRPGRDLYGRPLPDSRYGHQLQDRAVAGVRPEARARIRYRKIEGAFADGTPYALFEPQYALEAPAYGAPHPELQLSPRIASQMIGLGLLEAVPEADLLARADPNDADGDGVSGRPNYVWDAFNGRRALGRFGWKANQPHLLQQVAAAFSGDMGITSALFPAEECTAAQVECRTQPTGGAPEIASDDLHKVVLYASALAVPARRDWDDPQVLAGKRLFRTLGCAACHVPVQQTGVHPTIPALSHQRIRPYTDLLLHDMGEGLADGRPDFEASGREWRTPPLWGIGLFETVNGHTRYLHDGRARNLLEAVLWHGGEAERAKERVLRLAAGERRALLAFLKSL